VSLETILRNGVRERPDVAALAALDQHQLSVLVWHYHDDDLPGPDAVINLLINGLQRPKGKMVLEHFRVDQDHSNAFTVWKNMGSPQEPTPQQQAQLEKAGRLAALNSPDLMPAHGQLAVNFTLPRQAVSLLVFRWE
jgi:xylan 1,4-beta-xylosidase